MNSYPGDNGPNYLQRAFIFLSLILVLGSFSRRDEIMCLSSQQTTIPDTLPFDELRKVEWKQINKLHAANGYLIAWLNNRKRIRISRKHYENYALKEAVPDVYDKTFTQVEIEPEYPGGIKAWLTYVKNNIQYPKEAIHNKIQGTVEILFVVETDGHLDEATVISGPSTGGLREEALRLVKESGNWHPAIQNLRVVKAYKRASVTFSR